MAYGNPEFARLKQLLLDHNVTIVMAGDTHDFEYYAEPAHESRPAVHYFVNGGGGAYLSLGTALDWPANAPTPEWAFYPTREALVDKIDPRTPWWKRSGVVVDEKLQGLAILNRASVGALRLQRRAVLPELCRGSGRTLVRSGASASIRRERAAPLAGSLAVTVVERGDRSSGRLGRVGGLPAVTRRRDGGPRRRRDTELLFEYKRAPQ